MDAAHHPKHFLMHLSNMPRNIRALGVMALFFCLLPVNLSAGENLAYYSDYFSFIGRDAVGYVAFALDNNRGVDGGAYQAEHFAVMYDQKAGWVSITGTGDYDNTQKRLERIPDSPGFKFKGNADSGIAIRSKENALALKIGPMAARLSDPKKNRLQRWGSAKAVLTWKERTIPGRVIYEYLAVHGWNRLSRTYAGTWDNFQGFYLVLDQGAPDKWRDLYLRSEGKGDRRRTRGFITGNGWHGAIHSPFFKAGRKAFNFGFYRWPQRWDILVKPRDEKNATPGQLSLHQVSRRNQSNWIIGGFAMSVVEGRLLINGETIPVIGWAELIK